MILFDLDGTLTDSNCIWEDIDTEFLGKRGLQSTEEYAHTVGHSIFPVAAQFTRDYYHLDLTPQEIMDEWTGLARDAYCTVALKPGAGAFLAQCKRGGEHIAMVTACVPELCRAALRAHGLEDSFEQIIFAQELGMEKRKPELFLRAAELLSIAPETCTMYEDAPANCAAAKAAGMTVVGVYDPFYRKYEEEMRKTCDQYIMSFEELLT